MAYVNNGNPGKITMDLPSANYIYELPLLSFGDIYGTLNLSAIFNRRMRAAGSNPFSFDNGLKLNIQKKIIMEGSTPVSFMEESGNCTPLMGNSAPYTFDDDSQRILRSTNNASEPAYVVEHPDFSMEYYNSNGMIHSVVDKYGNEVLSFTYSAANGKMMSVCYRTKKNIQFTYSNNRLSTINYLEGGSTIGFNYADANRIVTVTYNSGETCAITLAASGSYYMFSAVTSPAARSTKLQEGSNTYIITDCVNNEVVNTETYVFPAVVSDYEELFSYIEATNYQGVTTALQYSADRLMYAYEKADAQNEKSYKGAVKIYRTADNILNSQENGILATRDGVTMTFTSNASLGQWQYDANVYTPAPAAAGNYILTGWYKRKASGSATISITGNQQHTFAIDSMLDGKWKFFAYKFTDNAAIIHAFVSSTNVLDTNDFRLTFQQTGVIAADDISHIHMPGHFLVSSTASIPFEDAVFCYSSGGIEKIIGNVTVSDIMRYKRKKKMDGAITEAYYNNCRGIVTNVPLLMVKFNGVNYGISNFDVVSKSYSAGNELMQRISVAENNLSSNIFAYSYVNNTLQSTHKMDKRMDVAEATVNGVTTTYARASEGLITSESVKDASNVVLYTRTMAYGTDASGNPTITATDEFGRSVVYTLDKNWGDVISTTLSDGSVITDNYDDDHCVKTGRVFVDTTSRSNSFTYTNGNLTRLQGGGLYYDFTYSKDELTAISKNGTQIEQHVHGKTSTNTTTNSYYPSSTNPLHSNLATYDKYGRLESISSVLTNVYDVDPCFNSSTGALSNPCDNGSARLAMSTDVNRAETSRFTYHKNGLLASKTVTDEEAFEDKISEETFAYDAINRVTDRRIIYDNANSKYVDDVIVYDKLPGDPASDNAVRSYTYKVNGSTETITQNTFDAFRRLSSKNMLQGRNTVTKAFTYDKSKVRYLTESIQGQVRSRHSYTYDAVGRIASDEYFSAGVSSDYRTYEYDKFGQLVRENNQALAKTFVYNYNSSNGNLISVKEYPYTLNTTPSGTAVTTTLGYTADKLTSFGGTTIAYNSMGCPTTYDGKTASWSKGKLSRLSSGTALTGTDSYSFSYNAFGQRVSKVYSHQDGTSAMLPSEISGYSKKYYYDHAGRLISEVGTKVFSAGGTATETIVFLYDESGMIGMMRTVGSTTNTYYFQRNLLGDVVAIYDTSGTMVAKYLYDAWGNCTISSDTTNTAVANANPIRYRGYYYDSDTGLYYCNARYYSPKWRRFISPDDTAYLDPEAINGLNLYCYCNNDPINYCDPSGHFVITLSTILTAAAIGLAVGATAGGVAGAAVAACNGTSILTGFISGFIGGAIIGAGAGVGALFLAPLIVGESVAIGIAGGVTALSTKAAIGAGLTIGGVTGAFGGGLADLSNQLGNNGMNWDKVDYGSVAISAVEYGILNMVSTGMGGLMGPYLSNAMNLLGSKMLNIIPTGWGFAIDVLRGQL